MRRSFPLGSHFLRYIPGRVVVWGSILMDVSSVGLGMEVARGREGDFVNLLRLGIKAVERTMRRREDIDLGSG